MRSKNEGWKMYRGVEKMKNAFDGLFAMAIGFLVTIPFALWKWIEIIIWVVKHVKISFQ